MTMRSRSGWERRPPGTIICAPPDCKPGPCGLSSVLLGPMVVDGNSRYPHAVRRLLAAILASTCLVAAAPAGAATLADTPLGTRLAKALRVPHVSPARSAALAVDLATGQPLYAQNDALPLAPASNEKLAVTYAALTAMGPAFRRVTRGGGS